MKKSTILNTSIMSFLIATCFYAANNASAAPVNSTTAPVAGGIEECDISYDPQSGSCIVTMTPCRGRPYNVVIGIADNIGQCAPAGQKVCDAAVPGNIPRSQRCAEYAATSPDDALLF